MAKINDVYDIGAAFEAVENELIASMIRNMKRHKAEESDEKMQWSMWQTEMLKSLEVRELILRIPDEQDGRFKRIVFTEKAAAVKDALNKEIHETEELLLRGISEKELKEFVRITEKMLQNLECSERG